MLKRAAIDAPRAPEGDTKNRIVDAAERVFLDHGGDGMSLRAVTGLAGVNIAAVNYHFGSKENLLHAVLGRRLDPLNAERLRLLDLCDARWPGETLTCEHVIAALFVPTITEARAAGPAGFDRLRFMGRAYSDPSPTTVGFIRERYDATAARSLEVFSRALPDLPRADLKLRLTFVLKSVAGLIASADLPALLAAFDRSGAAGSGEADDAEDVLGADAALLASLGSLMAGALMAPSRERGRNPAFAEMFALTRSAGTATTRPRWEQQPLPRRVLPEPSGGPARQTSHRNADAAE